MKFIDEATIQVRSGRGGNGLVSFRREKYVPKGGPDGGDGGRGADVVLEAAPGKRTLLDYHFKRKFRAPDGAPGGPSRRTGRSGETLVLPVPVGTLVFDENGEVLADLVEPGQREVMVKGGKPGQGNARFALPWRQAPDFAIPPGDGEARVLKLELKLLADVGLVGLPNAGKSTLVNRVSKAKARVADYPFTTLIPNLGVVALGDRTFVVADLPGLIEGAAAGAGLGHQFLRHCERTRVLVHLVDVSDGGDAVANLEKVRFELAGHGAGLEDRPWVLVASKVDSALSEEPVESLRAWADARGVPFMSISALTGHGIPELIGLMASRVLQD
jgi:GTP-binding protein